MTKNSDIEILDRLNKLSNQFESLDSRISNLEKPIYRRPSVIGTALGTFFALLALLIANARESRPITHFFHDTISTKKVVGDEIKSPSSFIGSGLKSFMDTEVTNPTSEFRKKISSLLESDLTKKPKWLSQVLTESVTFQPSFGFQKSFTFGEEQQFFPSTECTAAVSQQSDEIVEVPEACLTKSFYSNFDLPFYVAHQNSALIVTNIVTDQSVEKIAEKVKFLAFQVDGIPIKMHRSPNTSMFYGTYSIEDVATNSLGRGLADNLRRLTVTLDREHGPDQFLVEVMILVGAENPA